MASLNRDNLRHFGAQRTFVGLAMENISMRQTVKTRLLASILALTSCTGVLANEAGQGVDWEASAELGYLLTSGNSDSETLISKFESKTTYKLWEHLVALEALNSSQNDERAAEKYSAELQSDYSLSERTYLLSNLNWEKDRFSGYDYQASWTLGAGYKVINTDIHKLRLELAPGYRVSEGDPGDKEEDAVVRAMEKFSWKLSESSQLEQSLSSEYGDSNTITRFKVSLASQINGSLSMKLGYSLKHNSDVAPGVEKTDRESSVTLVYQLN